MIAHTLDTTWGPPVRVLLSVNADAGEKRIATITENDVNLVLNKIADQMTRDYDAHTNEGKSAATNPADYYYFLCDICMPTKKVDEDAQQWTRELVLGKNLRSALRSCFTYNTRVVDDKVEIQLNTGFFRPKRSGDTRPKEVRTLLLPPPPRPHYSKCLALVYPLHTCFSHGALVMDSCTISILWFTTTSTRGTIPGPSTTTA